jgi:excisionase family DNA binding protein
MVDKPLTYTVEQVAKMLGLSRGSTYEAIRKNEIPHVWIGRRILIPRVLLERFLETGKW